MKADSSATERTQNSSLAAIVAPEDLNCGDYVAILNEVTEFPSFFWCETAANERHETVRMRCLPRTSGPPLVIKAICLPFVFVASPSGNGKTIDIRRAQLARLDRRYGDAVWKELRKRRAAAGRRAKRAAKRAK